jgi:hypothetical protein
LRQAASHALSVARATSASNPVWRDSTGAFVTPSSAATWAALAQRVKVRGVGRGQAGVRAGLTGLRAGEALLDAQDEGVVVDNFPRCRIRLEHRRNVGHLGLAVSRT